MSQDNEKVKPHHESNDDKGDQSSYKNVKPERKPNQQPEQPLKEQK